MYKKNIALIVSAVVFAAVTVLVGCSSKDENPGTSSEANNTTESSETNEEEGTTQPDPLAPKETSSVESSGEEPSAEPTEDVTVEPSSGNGIQPPETDENGAVIFEIDDTVSDAELIAAAQTLYESACSTDWNYHVGCPYTLDYSVTAENDMGWQFYLVTDSGINSLADVEADYYKVFSDSYANDLSEIFLERDGRVYALDGERGANIYYTGSAVTSVKERGSDEILFTVENYYSGSDYTGNESFTETTEFSAVISPDGTWRAGKFNLPY